MRCKDCKSWGWIAGRFGRCRSKFFSDSGPYLLYEEALKEFFDEMSVLANAETICAIAETCQTVEFATDEDFGCIHFQQGVSPS
jgi:hypothetical protein